MTIVIQLVLYCFLLWLIVKVVVGNNAINGLYFYPKAFQECAISRGLIDRATVQKKRRNCMIALYVLLLVAPVLMIGVWNRVTDFWTAYGQGVLFLEVMNWFDGLVIDMLWVGHSKFWAIPKMEDMRYTQAWGADAQKAPDADGDLARRCVHHCGAGHADAALILFSDGTDEFENNIQGEN